MTVRTNSSPSGSRGAVNEVSQRREMPDGRVSTPSPFLRGEGRVPLPPSTRMEALCNLP